LGHASGSFRRLEGFSDLTPSGQRVLSDLEPHDELLTGWGLTAPSRASVYQPTAIQQVTELMTICMPRGMIARGLGRSYGDPAQNAGGAVIDMTALTGVHDVDLQQGTVVVDAGMSLHRLMTLFVPLGLFAPVTPGTRYVTVGGAIAADIHGKNHHADGSFSNHVLAFDLLLPGGEVRRVSREFESNLFRATAGGMGLTGIILSATIRMIRIETSKILVDTERAPNLDDLMSRMVAGDNRYRYSVAWVDTLARGRHFGRGVLYRGNHATFAHTGTDMAGSEALKQPRATKLAVPNVIPSGLVGRVSAQAFNQMWFARHPTEERDRLQELSPFFHQLDMVANANRLFGRGGFVQHQCVLPDGEETALRRIIQRLSEERCPTFLVVLKRMGPGNGLLSFPIRGWTLAIDIPASWPCLAVFLDELDELVTNADGRLYLAKDSRMRPEHLTAMYPELEAWRAIVSAADPEQRMNSDLARRLNLHG
jgi:decaprenylphospho-beta-D-ribofuranose 2-oxidase